MIIIGCDFHTRFQQIAMLDPTTGEVIELRLEHETGEAERFYATLPGPARVGIEATIHAQWFERTLRRYHHDLWIGDAAQIRAARVRKQKTDSRDALHILDLLLTNHFPRIWTPPQMERDLRQMVRHRHKLVRFRTSVMNQLHGLAISQGLCRKSKLWSRVGRQELEALALGPWASRRRRELLQLLDQLTPWIRELDGAVQKEAERRPETLHLMKQPGVGPVTALSSVPAELQPLIVPPQFRIKFHGDLGGLDQQVAHQGVASPNSSRLFLTTQQTFRGHLRALNSCGSSIERHTDCP